MNIAAVNVPTLTGLAGGVEHHAGSLVVVGHRQHDGEHHHAEDLEDHARVVTIALSFTP